MPYRPISAAFCSTGQGNSSVSSYSGGDRTDLPLGELVDPLLGGELVLGELEVHVDPFDSSPRRLPAAAGSAAKLLIGRLPVGSIARQHEVGEGVPRVADAEQTEGGTATGRRRMRAPERRAQLLDVARRAFGTSGFHAVSMDEVAEQAGVTKPILYDHFPSKKDLYLALLDADLEVAARHGARRPWTARPGTASASGPRSRPTSTSSTRRPTGSGC